VPLKEFECRSTGCANERAPREFFCWHLDDTVVCPSCGKPEHQLISRVAVIRTGEGFSRYTDKRKDGWEKAVDGFWAYERKNVIDGKPHPVWIDTIQKLREYAKSEGVEDPTQNPTEPAVDSEGKWQSQDGMPGAQRRFLAPESNPILDENTGHEPFSLS
jgi:predicted nucleic acid-binding Zn ribbon protein